MAFKGIGVTHYLILLCGMLVISALPAAAQDSHQTTTTRRTTPTTNYGKATSTRTVENGKEIEFDGTINKVDGDVIGVVDSEGAETPVLLQPSTRIRSAGKHKFMHVVPTGSGHGEDKSALLVGLPVRVEGRGNCSGQLVAESIKYRCDPCGCARMTAQVLGEQARLADELAETTELASTAAKGARAAQEAADRAQNTANKAESTATAAQATAMAAQARISAIDDFELKDSLTVNFKAGSAVLSDEAKAKLDEFASKTASAKGYVIEIAGYASKEGTLSRNELLSARRADAVMDYLVGTGKVPIRRLTTPYSGGISNPIADNSTPEGREQNRRAEVKMLVSKGLSSSETVAARQP